MTPTPRTENGFEMSVSISLVSDRGDSRIQQHVYEHIDVSGFAELAELIHVFDRQVTEFQEACRRLAESFKPKAPSA